jgi:hypothetical protein
MKYRGNKSGLYVDQDEYKTKEPPLIKILAALAMICALLAVATVVRGDALPNVEQQNFERWLVPGYCDERCCEDEGVEDKGIYAMIVIDRTKAHEIGGMDSLLPGMKINDNAYLSARIVDDGTLEIIVFVRGLNCKECWEVYHTYNLIMP